jgi:glycerophosphoryl diester phosphodiesterase
VWTVDRPDEARALWSAGVAGMVSNDPATILAARRAW